MQAISSSSSFGRALHSTAAWRNKAWKACGKMAFIKHFSQNQIGFVIPWPMYKSVGNLLNCSSFSCKGTTIVLPQLSSSINAFLSPGRRSLCSKTFTVKNITHKCRQGARSTLYTMLISSVRSDRWHFVAFWNHKSANIQGLQTVV